MSVYYDFMAVIRPWREESAAALAAEGLALLEAGALLALPTETFYALAAHPDREEALARLYKVKGREAEKPVLLLVSGPEMLPGLVREVPATAARLIRRFWPGPLTLILPARPELSRRITGGTGTVGVRQPGHSATCRLLAAWGFPVTGTSANRAGQAPFTEAHALAQEFGGEVGLIVEAGPCPGGQPSTILDLTTRPPTLVRAGALAIDEILAVISAIQTKEGCNG